ncbi:MAG: IS5 family transposase [Rhodospirillaceae bacterium]|nr:IS5 family transposase [Rhodospirillaceae bacterium]MBL6932392.1 IS5 family transposase [Rhodospirillales bacterium]
MKPREPEKSGQHDMFRSRLDQILKLSHEKVILADRIDWRFLSEKMGAVYTDGPGQPPLSNRLMAGLHILKYVDNLSDDEVCARWLENPYYQYFCGEEFFCHDLPLDRSSMTRWRQRMGEDRLNALLQESLAVAVKVGAAKPSDFTRAVIDTTVAEKDVAFPTDAKLIHKARERLVKQAKRSGIKLRQSYVRVGKHALIAHQRYAHAKQFKRANRQLRKLKTYLGRTIRDIRRKSKGDEALESAFLRPLWLGERVMTQKKRDPLPKIYALHAPEVECIGKGKAHKPYEFGVKVSVATTLNRCRGGQFAIHAKSLPGRPYDGHTLETVIPEIEDLTGAILKRILADAGYKGHNAPGVYKLRVFTAGQKRRVTPAIKRQMKRRSAVEPVIGHMKNDHRMDRNRLAHAEGDAINPILAAAGYNFRLILKWIRILFALFRMWRSGNYKQQSVQIAA